MQYRLTPKGEIIDENNNILSVTYNKDGYPRVCMNGKMYYIHRVLAQLFIPNPHNYPIVKHLDHNKRNYTLSNLQWDTQQKNIEESCAKTYIMTAPNGDRVTIFNMELFCREQNLTSQNMHMVYRGTRTSHKGWTK